jgi:hypothetical protein
MSREVTADGSRQLYRVYLTEKTAQCRARRPKPAKPAADTRLRQEVERRRGERWSLQQIAARLVRGYPDGPEMRVSRETIYRSLIVQARGTLRNELTACLRTGASRVVVNPRPAPNRALEANGQPQTCGGAPGHSDSFALQRLPDLARPAVAPRTRDMAAVPAWRALRHDDQSLRGRPADDGVAILPSHDLASISRGHPSWHGRMSAHAVD